MSWKIYTSTLLLKKSLSHVARNDTSHTPAPDSIFRRTEPFSTLIQYLPSDECKSDDCDSCIIAPQYDDVTTTSASQHTLVATKIALKGISTRIHRFKSLCDTGQFNDGCLRRKTKGRWRTLGATDLSPLVFIAIVFVRNLLRSTSWSHSA